MRRRKTTLSGEYRIDCREREHILEQIEKLARSYVPQWHFNREDPDIGSVIALLYADMMAENIERYNGLLERDYGALINMTGISLRPAHPARTIVEMRTAYDTIPGRMVPKGTKLLGGPDDERNIVFQTARSVYVTTSAVISGFMTSGADGKVIPVIGDFGPVEYIEGETRDGEMRNPVQGADFREGFRLFDFSGKGYGKYGLLMYHPHLFDCTDADIRMEWKGAGNLPEEIAAGTYRMLCYTDNGFAPVTDVRPDAGRGLVFCSPERCRKVVEQGRLCSVLLLEPVEPVRKNVTAADIRFSSEGKPVFPELIWNGDAELEPEKFEPFGNELSLYSELYIFHPYFEKAGAQIVISFLLELIDYRAPAAAEEKETELKIIKRSPRRDVHIAPAHVYVNEFSLEYYNGIGWRTLRTEVPVRHMFENAVAGECSISFPCPHDWQRQEAGGVSGYCVRLRILRADNCYYQPSVHHCPCIHDLRVSYSYGERSERPWKLVSISGSRKRDLTEAMTAGKEIPVFSRSVYYDTSLYLGFDKAPKDGPVSILFCLDGAGSRSGRKLLFSYSGRGGFHRLKLTDRTDGLAHTGTILFMPPPDMEKITMEGQTAYWIRITEPEPSGRQYPVVRRIAVNGVEADNIEMLEEEEYYMDASVPNMSFAVGGRNILTADVWVNETALFSVSEMKEMLLSRPDMTKAEYDLRGNIKEFYVKWKEVDNFDCSVSGDRHFIVDRINNRICFGDGVHAGIPKNTAGTAFKAVISCCSGQRANVGTGRIDTAYGNIMFIDRISNPVQAYGGADMETVEEALCRGTTVLNTGNRLISAMDYERAALDFSGQICQAKAVVERKKDGGRDSGAVTIVILMEDYRDGPDSFIHAGKRLKEYLISCCELSVAPDKLEIVEPVYVRISVEVWVKAADGEDVFELQRQLILDLEAYLDPVKNQCWEIGRMAGQSQIELALRTKSRNALIRRVMVTASWDSGTGMHETDPLVLAGNPFILVTGGTHKIHFE